MNKYPVVSAAALEVGLGDIMFPYHEPEVVFDVHRPNSYTARIATIDFTGFIRVRNFPNDTIITIRSNSVNR